MDKKEMTTDEISKLVVDDFGRVFLHEVIWVMINQIPIPEGHYVFHVNGDSLDNRRKNLVLVKGNRASYLNKGDFAVRDITG